MAHDQEKARSMDIRRVNGTRKRIALSEVEKVRGSEYLVAHACFGCNKSWKMKPDEKGHVCPECAQSVCFMGRSFKAPKKSDIEQWKKVRRLWMAGFRFYS